jgi:hypothetical protein
MLSLLTFTSFEPALLPSSSQGSHVGGRFLAFYPNRLVSSEGHHRQHEQASLVGGVKKKPLVSGVAEINTVLEDLIVYSTPSPP